MVGECVLFSIQQDSERGAGWPLISVLPRYNYKTLINLDIDSLCLIKCQEEEEEEVEGESHMEAVHLHGSVFAVCAPFTTKTLHW